MGAGLQSRNWEGTGGHVAVVSLIPDCFNGWTKLSRPVCRVLGRPGRRRTETRCGTPGARGANVPVPAEAGPPTRSEDASVQSKEAFNAWV